jgi:DNA polymerase-4
LRKIVHIDMDAFYAAVEQRDQPALRGLPIAVGGGQTRGVVMTASYDARRFGVRSAMPGARAARLCPELVFVRPRFEVYKEVSRQIRAIFRQHATLVEPLSLDEAYLDVTEPPNGPLPAVAIARAIKDQIRDETGLTASAGVSCNKFLAKLASDMEKPDGLCLIRPAQVLDVLAELPIERFFGVGPATASRLRAAGIRRGADLQALDEAAAVHRLGRSGAHYWRLAQGRDDRPVVPDRSRKSLSVETTFDQDIAGVTELTAALEELARDLAARLAQSGYQALTVHLKIKYLDFRISTRQTTLREAPRSAESLAAVGRHLLLRAPLAAPVRLLGIGVGGATTEAGQLTLGLDPQPADQG